MGFWGSLVSTAVSVVSSAVKIIDATAKVVGRVIVEKSRDLLKLSIDTLKAVTEMLEVIAKSIDILTPNENMEDLGDRATRADKNIEDFDSSKEYIQYLRDEVTAKSEDEIEMLPASERVAKRVIGGSIVSKAIEEEFSVTIPVKFWDKVVSARLSGDEITQLLKRFDNKGIEPKDFAKYIDRELSGESEEKIDTFLLQTYKEIEPNATQQDIEEKILDMQRVKG